MDYRIVSCLQSICRVSTVPNRLARFCCNLPGFSKSAKVGYYRELEKNGQMEMADHKFRNHGFFVKGPHFASGQPFNFWGLHTPLAE